MSGHGHPPEAGHEKPKEKNPNDVKITEALQRHKNRLRSLAAPNPNLIQATSGAIRLHIESLLGKHLDKKSFSEIGKQLEAAEQSVFTTPALTDVKEKNAELELIRAAQVRHIERSHEARHAPKPERKSTKFFKGAATQILGAPFLGMGHKYNPLAWPVRYLVRKPAAYTWAGVKERPIWSLAGAVAGSALLGFPLGTAIGTAATAASAKAIAAFWKKYFPKKESSGHGNDDHGGHH